MFGRKQETKELEAKLENCQAQLDDLNERVKEAKEMGRNTTPYFESQIAAQSEMDKHLTKVVGNAHQSVASSQEGQKALEKLAVDLTGIRTRIEEEEDTKKKLVGMLDENIENLLSCAEESKKNHTPVEFLQQMQEGLEGDLASAQSVVADMKDFSKEMCVLCLNSAVEAGRMGEDGQRFVAAAQEVREYVEKYESSAAQAVDHFRAMEERVKQIGEQLGNLIGKIQAGQDKLKGLAGKFEDQLKVCGEMSKNRFSDQIYSLSADIRQMTQNHEDIQNLQASTLSEMENIGESFMDEQEARKELEKVLDKITNMF